MANLKGISSSALIVLGLVVAGAVALITITACGWPSYTPAPYSPAPMAATSATYEVRGVLKDIDAKNQQVTIAHEEIPGYMPAMTMAFRDNNFSELRDLKPGDRITFRLNITGSDAWINHVKKSGDEKIVTPKTSDAAPLLTPASPGAVRELTEGDLMPDVELVNEQGKKIGLGDFHGKVLAITFIYTRCPLPTYCPLINRNFQAAQSLLKRLDADGDWCLLSITLDPAFDTPAVLDAESKTYHADPQHWGFATGSEEAVRKFGAAVGLEFNTTNGQINHNLRTVVLNGEGRILRIYRGNTWTPQELAAEIHSALPRH